LLGSVEFTGQTVIADLEAGIGTLTRLQEKSVDAVLIVLEPTPRAIQVGTRAAELAREKALGTVIVVANRIRTPAEVALIRDAFPDDEVMAVPDDEAIVRAERDGVAPLDTEPDSPAVRALVAIAERLATA
jgi:CO dehydrogenase nickel-insertion accessory protein CooC1